MEREDQISWTVGEGGKYHGDHLLPDHLPCQVVDFAAVLPGLRDSERV